MNDSGLDVFVLSEEVERDRRSQALPKELLAKGHTLYGFNSAYPDYLERTTPNGNIDIGQLVNGKFEVKICLLPNY